MLLFYQSSRRLSLATTESWYRPHTHYHCKHSTLPDLGEHSVTFRVILLPGWKTVLHYGSLIGAYSLLTLLPELQLGVFSSYNGAVQHDPYTINSLLHVHLIDMLLGAKPSVNASYWCSHLDSRRSESTHSTADETRGSPLYHVGAYVGIYWHTILGQFEVWDEGTGTLMARYGSLEVRLQPLQSGLAFIGVPTDPAWVMLIHNVRVEFAAVNGHQQCRRVSVDLLKLTTFERRHQDDSRGASAASQTLSSCAVTALMCVIITLIMFHHCRCVYLGPYTAPGPHNQDAQRLYPISAQCSVPIHERFV